MIKQYLNVSNYKYCAEFIPYEEQGVNKYSAQFVMLRNFKLLNDIAVDDNIYFIEKKLFNKYQNVLSKKLENNILVFPTNTSGMSYSQFYNIFNDTFIDDDLLKNLSVYNIYKKEIKNDKYIFTEKFIKCNAIRIYHPHTCHDHNLIIHIENIINNIHVHYICNTYNNFNNNSITEFRYDNNIYSEFITCYIPDIKDLFDRIFINGTNGTYDYETYFKENLNIINDVSPKNKIFINNTIILLDNDNNKIDLINDNYENNIRYQYVPLALLTQPFAIEQDNGKKEFKKLYFKYSFNIENNYITAPINLSLFPYSYIDDYSKIYVLNTLLSPGYCTFSDDYKFSLAASCDFGDNGVISIVTEFNYPEKDSFWTKNQITAKTAFADAYCFYNNITNKKIYDITGLELVETYKNELDEIRNLTSITDEQIKNILKDNPSLKYENNLSKTYLSEKEYYLEQLKQKRFESFIEEYKEEYGVDIDFFGFAITIASDKKLKNVIYKHEYSLLKEFKSIILNDTNNELLTGDIIKTLLKTGKFYFNINQLFTDWAQMPDNIICQVSFKDRFIGVEINSNKIIISKEKFKYITNKGIIYRLESLKEINNNMKEINLNTKSNELDNILNNLEISDENKNIITNYIQKSIQENSFKFINNINCSIQKLDDVKDNINSHNSNNSQIVYKPIFYKVQQAQNIKLKYQQNQNIGIDLHEYMSKVDIFIISLNNSTYTEIGRNANYVIFNINANTLSTNSGSYEIYNQDNEYITYGTWNIVV